MSCSVYIIAPEGMDKPIKIGVAVNPRKRLKQLQTGNPARLRIVTVYRAPSRAVATDWEHIAHNIFADHRIAGEWFDVHHDQITDRKSEWQKRRKNPTPRPALLTGNDDFKPFHPVVPDRLCRPVSEMSQDERLEFWSCFNLNAPPPGFDDWYIIGSASSGVMGAFPVEGFVNGEPD